MKVLLLDRPLPGATFEKYQPHIVNEVRHSWAAYKSGLIREIYFRQDRPGVAIMAEAASVEEAKKAFSDLPLVKAGLIDWDVIPLGAFVNWELLFAPGNK
jgi:hypothetical protein